MVNRGEEKLRVQMNVVPRSTRNTNSGTDSIHSSGLFMVLSSTLIYTSELTLFHYLCS